MRDTASHATVIVIIAVAIAITADAIVIAALVTVTTRWSMDIKEIEGVSLDTYAGKAIAACRNKLYGILGNSGHMLVSMMDVATYIMLHNKMAAKGYFVTQENREEMYIKMLEAGDTELFELLEKYISYLDIVEALSAKVDEYNKLVEQIKLNADADEAMINDIVKDYLNR